MKKKSVFIVLLATISLFVAHSTAGASSFWVFHQPQMPASLQKNSHKKSA